MSFSSPYAISTPTKPRSRASKNSSHPIRRFLWMDAAKEMTTKKKYLVIVLPLLPTHRLPSSRVQLFYLSPTPFCSALSFAPACMFVPWESGESGALVCCLIDSFSSIISLTHSFLSEKLTEGVFILGPVPYLHPPLTISLNPFMFSCIFTRLHFYLPHLSRRFINPSTVAKHLRRNARPIQAHTLPYGQNEFPPIYSLEDGNLFVLRDPCLYPL